MHKQLGVIGGTLSAVLLATGASVGNHPTQQIQSNERCYTVDEPSYKGHYPDRAKEVRPIERCYSDKAHPYRYSIVDIPVSLAAGTVRTPEFSPPKTNLYWIMVQVEKPLPTKQLGCMMAAEDDSPMDGKDCPLNDRLLRADWTVWEDGKIALSGSSTTHSDASWSKDYIFKFLGKFPAAAGKKYSLEVKFTKDGTPLNVASPHLIITKVVYE